MEITMDEFETFAIDRLIVLRAIESIRIRNLGPVEEAERLSSYLHKHLHWRAEDGDFEQDRRKDLISHFILRLSHCQSEDQRRWFLAQESFLFKYRLEQLSSQEVSAFMRANGLMFEAVDDDEKMSLEKDLMTVGVPANGPGSYLSTNIASTDFFKVPFAQALDLVSKRKVLIKGGMAYVPSSNVTSIVVARFRTNLSKSLLVAAQSFGAVANDPRVGPLLQGVHRQYVGEQDFNSNGQEGIFTPEHLDQIADQSMPLCMRGLHKGVKQDHKLRHQGRQQYWLYLKGAGLSMEDSIRFFQNEFTKVMTAEQFQKEHMYNIRHAYGKEGKRTSYSPYSCMKIIMGPAPGQGEHHGCPYRHQSEQSISALFGSMNINGADREKIMVHVKKQAFQVACQRHFEVTHPNAHARGVNTDGVGNHPNAWTSASVEYHHGGDKATAAASMDKSGKAASEPAPAFNAGAQAQSKGSVGGAANGLGAAAPVEVATN